MSMINSLNYGNGTHTFTLPYGVCSTAADTAAKTVTVDNFSLETGAAIIVKFTNANNIASPTLNVNNTGAKPIMRYGTTAASTGTTTSGWIAGAVQLFVYDGTNWIREYWNNTIYSNVALGQGYTTCSTAETTTAKTASLSSYALTTGGIVSVKFTYAVPASSTLNINSKGAKAIYHKGAAIAAGVIKAGDTATFIYNGTYYHLIAVDRDDNTTYNLGSFGVTATAAELNIMDGVTATTTELNYVDGVTSNIQTQLNNKASKSVATSSADGLMSASDKKKLDTVRENAGKEAYLSWGGQSIAGNISPLDVAMSDIHSANRLAFANPNGITIEYSRDNGSTWTSYSTNDSSKISLVSGLGGGYNIGGRTTGNTINDKVRVTLHATNMGVYTKPRKLLLYISTENATGSNVLVEYATKGDQTTFKTLGTYNISGWPGWNSIPIDLGTFGGGSNQLTQNEIIRLTFGITGVNSDSTKSSALSIKNIALHGETYWTTPSEMARTGHLYSYDSVKNATFPAKVTATSFSGDLTGNATSASKLQGVTATVDEINKLDGLTATTTELNYVDGVTSNIQTQLNAKAPLASPTFTGTPKAPTAAAGTNTTQVATTAFVQTGLSDKMDKTNPTGTGSFSLNRKSGTTVGTNSIAIGYNVTASGDYSYAEGNRTTASGYASHAEGFNTTASGSYSHAEGFNSIASESYSHAEGTDTIASGQLSHAEGLYTIASEFVQHVQGKYNISDTVSAHIVGNGESEDTRSNAHTLDWEGNAWYAGDVYVGSTSGTNKDSGSKKLATENYVTTAVNGTKSNRNAVTLAAASWTGSEAPFSYAVTISGHANTTDLVELIAGDAMTAEQIAALQAANIVKAEWTNNTTLTLYAYGTKPAIDAPVTIIVRKD